VPDVAPFLIGRIDSKKATKTHVCPHGLATEGELAVYALQHLLRVNWFSLPGTTDAFKKASATRARNQQQAVRILLNDADAREEIKRLFRTTVAVRT
jgi:hypothetical protein